ncbi:MAG: hypothetical protein JW787_07635 [Sedimentisphaerales bacterium]|nr:hypothetical protein [Sedimentisphaerales bacterium]
MLALDTMGPPKAGLPMGEWGLGIDFSHSDMDLLRKTANWSDAENTISVEADKIYANVGYGLSDNVTGFVRLGAGQADSDRKTDWTKWGGDGDPGFVWGGGFKATVIENEKVTWGFLGQFSRGKYSGDAKSSVDGEKAEYDIKMTEMQIAAGPTYKLSDAIHIYGGPFVYFADGEYKDTKDDGDKLYKPIEEKNVIGGYVGVLMNVKEKVDINVEYQDTGKAWAIAGGLTFPF